MAPVLVLRLALRGVSGFWLLRQVTSTRKRFSPGMRWTIWRRKQGEWPGPPWKGDPRCSQSPPAFRAAMQVTKGVSSVPSQPAAFFPSPRVAPTSWRAAAAFEPVPASLLCHMPAMGTGLLSLFAVDTMEGASATPWTPLPVNRKSRRKQGSQDWRCVC